LARKIILVRHGETDWNREKRIQGGASNPPLNEEGRRQAESLALRLSKDKLQAIYSSPLKRSLDTAKTIARPHQLAVGIEPSLREIAAGDLEGITISELGRRFSELLTLDTKKGALPKAPGGESLPEVQQRGWDTIQRLTKKHPDGALVLVSHYFVILTIICLVLKMPLSQIGRLRLSTGSISVINLDKQTAQLELFNDTGYLVK
jgi:broad specificity phosphatase PhoE